MAMKFSLFAICTLLITIGQYVDALDNGLAATPPMGWLAWERFTCEIDCKTHPDGCINSKLFEDMADRLVSDGYKDAGYKYINIDDCWSTMERDNKTERLIPDPERFPGGISALADYIHKKDLLLGIYGDCGTSTCAGYPAQLKTESNMNDNYFYKDADTFDQWKVDSFKFDGCNIEPESAESICPQMALALTHNTRPVLLVCEWPFYLLRKKGNPDYSLAQKSCNAWRYYEDVEDSWSSVLDILDFTVKMQDTIVKYHGPGAWFDPDQLVIGNFGLSLDQAEAQMALWCLWSAPLYMSNDLRKIKPEMAALLKNQHLIEVNQDEFGIFGLLVDEMDHNRIQAFVKPIHPVQNACPSFVILYLNRNTLGNSKRVSFKTRDLLKKAALAIGEAGKRSSKDFSSECLQKLASDMISTQFNAVDLISGRRLPTVLLNSTLDLEVNPSGVRIVKLTEIV